MQAVDGVGGDLHRGVEPEREVGGREVVVDRLRHAHEIHAVTTELGGDAERVLAADGDQRVDALTFDRVVDAGDAVLGLVRVRPRAPEDRPSPVEQPPCVGGRQLDGLAIDDAAPSVTEPDDVVAVDAFTFPHDGSDHRVEARAVSAAGENADPHLHLRHRVSLHAGAPSILPQRRRSAEGVDG